MSFYIIFAVFFIAVGVALSFAYSRSGLSERFGIGYEEDFKGEDVKIASGGSKKASSHRRKKTRGRRAKVDEEEIAAHSKIMELKVPPPLVEQIEAVPTKNDPKSLARGIL